MSAINPDEIISILKEEIRNGINWQKMVQLFFEKMKNDFELTEDVYEKCGTLFFATKIRLN